MTQATAPTVEELQAQFTAELGKRFDQRDNDLLAKLEKMWKEEIAKALAEQSAKQAGFSIPGSETATHRGQKYSFARAMAAAAMRQPELAPMEFAMSKELEGKIAVGKAMSFGTDTSGGFLVPNEVLLAELIPLLYAESVCVQLGATTLNGLTRAPVQIPRVSGGTTAYWLGEAATITASDLATQQMTLTPHGLFCVTVVSDLLQMLDSPGVETMVRNDMARQLGLKLDLGALAGTGASGQPIGITQTTGINASAITAATPTYDELLAAVFAVLEDNALMGKPGWALCAADMLAIAQAKDVTGGTDNKSNIQPLGPRSLLSGQYPNYTLLGYPAKVSTQLATTDGIIFGNWADLVIAQWGGMKFTVTDALGLLTAQSHIRGLTYADIGVRHAVSFNVG